VLVIHIIADFTLELNSVIPGLQYLSSDLVGLIIQHDARHKRMLVRSEANITKYVTRITCNLAIKGRYISVMTKKLTDGVIKYSSRRHRSIDGAYLSAAGNQLLADRAVMSARRSTDKCVESCLLKAT